MGINVTIRSSQQQPEAGRKITQGLYELIMRELRFIIEKADDRQMKFIVVDTKHEAADRKRQERADARREQETGRIVADRTRRHVEAGFLLHPVTAFRSRRHEDDEDRQGACQMANAIA